MSKAASSCSTLRELPLLALVVQVIHPLAFADTVTLRSGEVIEGAIQRENEKEIQIEVVKFNRTIFSLRTGYESEVKDVHRGSPERKAELVAYDVLQKYQLSPHQVHPSNYTVQAIARFENFLCEYPDSEFATDVRLRIAQWREDLE